MPRASWLRQWRSVIVCRRCQVQPFEELPMRGIISHGGYLPHHRLQRSAAAAVLGGRPRRGTRAVASHDEDTTTMAVEAGRRTIATTGAVPSAIWFSTANPTYLDKTNATTMLAALQLPRTTIALDLGGAVRSGLGALISAGRSAGTVLAISSDMRGGLPASADELGGGDGAAAFVIGDDAPEAPVIAEIIGSASTSEEFFDAWRIPGEQRTKHWEERFGETRYVPLANEALTAALAAAGVDLADVAHVVTAGLHSRAISRAVKGWKLDAGVLADDLFSTVGNTGTAHAAIGLSSVLDVAKSGAVIAVVGFADGADVMVLRATEAISDHQALRPIAAQAEGGDDGLDYATFLSWRGQITKEPPRRPEPARMSAPAATRTNEWKYAFVGSRDRDTGTVHMPPSRVSMDGSSVDEMDLAPMAAVKGTLVTFTVDRISYSQSPPVVFGVIDFDGGGRLPMELTDVDADALSIGDRVEMAFRVLNRADWLTNYFWKARPLTR